MLCRKYDDSKISICPNCPADVLPRWDNLTPWCCWVSRLSQMSRLFLYIFNDQADSVSDAYFMKNNALEKQIHLCHANFHYYLARLFWSQSMNLQPYKKNLSF